jgi:peptide deformylase
MGDARLLLRAEPVTDFGTRGLRELVRDMMDTMEASGGVGLAAPQIGVSLQLVIFGFETSARYPQADAVPFTILANPVLTDQDETREEGWEGCLSLPGLRGLVPRHRRLSYAGFDAEGRALKREVEGFHARVVQHECDHLWGILYPMRMNDMSRFGFSDVLFPGNPGVEE